LAWELDSITRREGGEGRGCGERRELQLQEDSE